MEIVSSIASKVFELLVDPIVRQIKYVFNYSGNIHKLEEEVEKLTHAKQRVEHTVEEVKRNPVEEVEADVPRWFTKVNNVTEDATKILLRHEDKAKRSCFMGLCPNLIRRHQISRKASQALPIVVEAREEGNFEKVSYRITPQGIGAVKGFEAFESRTSAVEQIMNALKDADVNLIGVYGMGGVGKTTLVKQIAAQVREYGIFKLQEIADWLDYKFDVESVEVRAARLSERIKREEKILIIVDDIWAAIKLEEVGIPYGLDHKGSKILMTSRNQSVLLEMGVQRDILLEVLQYQEAWNLFEKIVGDLKDSNLRPIAIEVAKRCAGLPILIVPVATGLKNKQMFEWNEELEGLKKFDGQGDKARVHSALELSYKFLRDEERSLFRLVGQLPPQGGHLIDLLKYSMGLGLFNQRTTLKATRDRLLKAISDLKMSCLLLEGDNHELVKMHDVVHRFAASIASKHHHVFTATYETELEEWPNKGFFEQCTSISLPYCKIPKLPEVLECPKLESFFMFNNSLLKIPENLFSRMEELKVLDLTGMHLSPLPLSLQCLENLQTLCLDGCVLEDISAIGELKQLQVLSFVRSTIVRLPSEVRKLTRLRLLDLRRCQGLEVISPDVLSRLAQLEELYIGDGFVQWKGEGHDDPRNNANLSELKLLSKLSTLEVHIMDANIMPKDLFSEKLERFRVFIGDEWDWDWHEYERYADYRSLRTLKLKLSRSALLERVKVLLMKTEDLYLDDLTDLRSVLYELDDQGFPELKHLHVQNSLGIQYIIDWMIMGHSTAFPRLESLFIDNLHNLEKIYYGPYMVGSFSNLRKLKVGNCNALRSLFSFSMFKGLGKLEEVDVSSCEIMEEIVVEEGEDDEEINLTQIRSLTLDNLPQLTSFCSQGQEKVCSASQRKQKEAAVGTSSKEIVCEDEIEAPLPLFSKKIEFPNLEDIKLSGINVKMIWPNQHIESSLYIEKLTTLIVDGCGNLNYLFTSSIVGSLAQLKTLEICECKSMEEVIIAEGEGEMMSKMLFPKLHSLKLKGLPRIVRFCTANLIECPSLKVLRVDNCPHLHAFLSTCTSKNVGTSSGVTQANATLFDEKVWFPNLEELYIMHMHKLEMIWCEELLADSFSRLKVLQVQYGKQLLKIFPSKLLGRFLQNLESLVVKNCDSVEEVFDLRALVRVSEVHVVERSQLRALDIRDLPNLKQVWNMDPHRILSFYNLRQLYAWNCPNLKSLLPFSIALGLPHLELLSINGCGMEEVVAKEERVEAITINPKFVFRGLKTLVLRQLEELRCFYSEKHSLECTQLKTLRVYGCKKLKTFNSESQEILMDGQESQLKIQVPQPLFAFREIVGNLEQLALNNEDIAMIQQSHFPIDLFFKLKILVLQSFHDASAAVISESYSHMVLLVRMQGFSCSRRYDS
ncbi:disease resistance protein At4g27190-like [Hevea brasiliensis]|uniref:disease resistance protein At4g27190-like n=1 Tax=Hevea brasiliensis TaxID=3981 RepID=UPI0025EC26CE|nr:disease resistance protein At4g27190-like [Hevea brasiliensis]